ncbi:hypothetical protein ACLBKU_16435 [Erythrobacter sp. NE805]|uniref:hypothetical protein n=1 Tax=Erythrobacter sp. NE805 TaxID=3389875 RepID=UPI00396B4104
MTRALDDWFAAYAAELEAGDRPAILARYHPEGAWMVRKGVPRLLDFAALTERYLGAAWQPPARFAWADLRIELVGSAGALAVGQFVWERANGRRELISYTGLLLRVEEAWKIRLEDENLAEILRPPS